MGKASCSGLVGDCEEQLLSWHLIFSKQFLRAIKQRSGAGFGELPLGLRYEGTLFCPGPEYLLLWNLVDNMLLQEGVEDQHR